MNVTQEFGFLNGGLFVEPCLIEQPIMTESIDGKITYAKGCQVLEKMRSLAWIYALVA